jgi:hypothetical protein
MKKYILFFIGVIIFNYSFSQENVIENNWNFEITSQYIDSTNILRFTITSENQINYVSKINIKISAHESNFFNETILISNINNGSFYNGILNNNSIIFNLNNPPSTENYRLLKLELLKSDDIIIGIHESIIMNMQ